MAKTNLAEVKLSSAVIKFARNSGFNYLIRRNSCSPSNASLPALEVALTDLNGKEQAYFWSNLNHDSIIDNTLYIPSNNSEASKNLCKLLIEQGYSIKQI